MSLASRFPERFLSRRFANPMTELSGVRSSCEALARTDWQALRLTSQQLWTLAYLGIVPSGLGFFLWNAGARQSRAGTLAVMNNAKVPLAVVCSLLVFGESASLLRLALGAAVIIGAVLISDIAPSPAQAAFRSDSGGALAGARRLSHSRSPFTQT